LPVIVVVVALAIALPLTLAGSSGTASPAKHQLPALLVAKLVPVGSATTDQLHDAATVILHRLQAVGPTGVQAVVSGGAISVTATSHLARLRAMFPAVLEPADLLFRPVLCAAPAYIPPKKGTNPPTGTPSCGAQYQLTAANNNVNTGSGVPMSNIGPDPSLAAYPTTATTSNPTADLGSKTVLLETSPNAGFGGERLVLGPAQVDSEQVASAQAFSDVPQWVVNLNLDSTGAKQWDALAQQQFHAYIGIDLDAQVVSAPLTLPNAASFTSFGGRVQISGNFTQLAAENLANDLASGPLPVRLEMAGAS